MIKYEGKHKRLPVCKIIALSLIANIYINTPTWIIFISSLVSGVRIKNSENENTVFN